MRVQVISPWYPDYASKYSGVFVEKQVSAVRRLGHEVDVEVPQIFPGPRGEVPESVEGAVRELAGRDLKALYGESEPTWYVPTIVPSGSTARDRGAAMAQAISLHRELVSKQSDVTHAHLGLPTGYASVLLSDRPLVVTEHQSTLDKIFADVDSTEAYAEVVEKARRFLCVSPHLKRQIIDAVGHWAEDKVEVLPNIVDLSDLPFVGHERLDFRNWIYVGGLASHKGIELLLKSFHGFRENIDADATLKLVGEGTMRSWIRRFSVAKGMANAVTMTGAVEHSELGPHLSAADVMVHLSPAETFGIASLEAIGAGLPVVSLRNGGAESAWGEFESLAGRILERDADASDVVQAVSELRADPSGLDLARARQEVESRFSPTVIGDKLLGIYEDVVG